MLDSYFFLFLVTVQPCHSQKAEWKKEHFVPTYMKNLWSGREFHSKGMSGPVIDNLYNLNP